jgi:cytoplasmic iron level regulating protein YaaA (DUF328/UPF0246 family)
MNNKLPTNYLFNICSQSYSDVEAVAEVSKEWVQVDFRDVNPRRIVTVEPKGQILSSKTEI